MTNTILDTETLSLAATQARGLAIDAVTACKSGHLGLPLGDAEIGAVLFGHALKINPNDPDWINRDRFVLSAGHGSMFLYAWLHLAGFDISLQDLKDFRKLHSKTPGHPEFLDTPGVEATTGPLGQGIGNAVGMAVAKKMAAAHYNTPTQTILDHHVVCLCGDGCIQEGVASEASAFAGHFGLDNLILIYDSNDVTLDAAADKTQSEDTAKRFEAYGFDVVTINGHDMDAFLEAFQNAKANKNKKPKIIIAKTEIGRGITEVAGTSKAHGEAGVQFAEEARKNLGLPKETFYVSQEVRKYFTSHKQKLVDQYQQWQTTYEAWQAENPELAKELKDAIERKVPTNLSSQIPTFPEDANIATRAAGEKIINALAQAMPLMNSGSADLHGSTKNYIKDGGDFDKNHPTGRNIHYGIREHAMGAIVNGMGYYGILRPSGATFLVFSDYLRPAIRLAAISKLPIFHIFTHDSIGVGEDGPTHQPVETTSSLRLIPQLDVIRPADPEETAGAYIAALERVDGPTALILSRQNLPNNNFITVKERREGVLKGAYIATKETSELEYILIATGSELQIALEATKELGTGTRVVSMPCCERFDRQDSDYRESILPKACTKRVAIEAGTTQTWYRYTGLEGAVIGIDRFGLSAPAPQVFQELGITKKALVDAAKSLK